MESTEAYRLYGMLLLPITRRAAVPDTMRTQSFRYHPGSSPTRVHAMLSIEKVLFAADFSENAISRLAYARAFAGRVGAELHVIHADVLHGAIAAGAEHLMDDAALKELHRMTETAAQYEGQPSDVPVKFVVERNVTAAPAILDYAVEADVDVIILGTHGRRGIRHLILGSVAEEVLRLARCPVLTLRSREWKTAGSGEVKSILVPIDFSKYSHQALLYAREIGALFDARLDLLHVVEETLHPAFYGITVQSVYDVDPDIESKAVKYMMKMVAELDDRQIEVSYHAGPGTAAREIAAFADEKQSGMIVMGTHGLTGLDHFLMGSTTERVVRRAACPVFVVKSFGKSVLDVEAEQS